VQQRGLADARGTDDGEHLALLHLQIEAAEDHHRHLGVPIGLRELLTFEEGHCVRL
jgi:hypothetical protein